jgi:hypothetical protein
MDVREEHPFLESSDEIDRHGLELGCGGVELGLCCWDKDLGSTNLYFHKSKGMIIIPVLAISMVSI